MTLMQNNKNINPDDFNLLIDLYKSKQFAKAEVRIKEMIAQFPNDINLHNLMGVIFFEKKEFSKLKNVLFCRDVNETCSNADLVIIHTEWDEFKTIDFKKISRNKKFKIYDMRNLYSPEKIKKLGFSYYSIGR